MVICLHYPALEMGHANRSGEHKGESVQPKWQASGFLEISKIVEELQRWIYKVDHRTPHVHTSVRVYTYTFTHMQIPYTHMCTWLNILTGSRSARIMFSLDRRIENAWAGNVYQWLGHCSGMGGVLSLIPQLEKKIHWCFNYYSKYLFFYF